MGAETIKPCQSSRIDIADAFTVQRELPPGGKLTRQGAEPVSEMWAWLAAIVSAAVVVWRGYVWWTTATRITVGPVSESWVVQHRGQNWPYR